MEKRDIKYIENFLEEVEALYDCDENGECIPNYIYDMVQNIRIIIKEETKHDLRSDSNV